MKAFQAQYNKHYGFQKGDRDYLKVTGAVDYYTWKLLKNWDHKYEPALKIAPPRTAATDLSPKQDKKPTSISKDEDAAERERTATLSQANSPPQAKASPQAERPELAATAEESTPSALRRVDASTPIKSKRDPQKLGSEAQGTEPQSSAAPTLASHPEAVPPQPPSVLPDAPPNAALTANPGLTLPPVPAVPSEDLKHPSLTPATPPAETVITKSQPPVVLKDEPPEDSEPVKRAESTSAELDISPQKQAETTAQSAVPGPRPEPVLPNQPSDRELPAHFVPPENSELAMAERWKALKEIPTVAVKTTVEPEAKPQANDTTAASASQAKLAASIERWFREESFNWTIQKGKDTANWAIRKKTEVIDWVGGLFGMSPASASAVTLPPELEPNVRFWKALFTQYGKDQVVINHKAKPDIIFGVIDIPHDAKPEERHLIIKTRLASLRADLDYLQHGSQPQSAAQKQLISLLRSAPGAENKYAFAAKELGTWTGMKEKFSEGIVRSGKYLPRMEEIFAARGLPKELARIPLVESSFKNGATSRVGAAGCWQFMPDTGRDYGMAVNNNIDERRDFFISTEAAAKYLLNAKSKLGTWGVAVTSFNHGVGGMKRAEAQTGSQDIGKIVVNYKGPKFGFASRNYYAEFLAANEVYENREKYFPGVMPAQPVSYREVTLTEPATVPEIAGKYHVQPNQIADLNPSYLDPVLSGEVTLPVKTKVRLPK